jgi:hypothetical protein
MKITSRNLERKEAERTKGTEVKKQTKPKRKSGGIQAAAIKHNQGGRKEVEGHYEINYPVLMKKYKRGTSSGQSISFYVEEFSCNVYQLLYKELSLIPCHPDK